MSEVYWSQFRNNPQHTGRSAVPSFRNPTLRWQTEIIENYTFEEVLPGRDGTVYVPTEKGCEAFDSATGQRKWLFPTYPCCHGLALSPKGDRIHLIDDMGGYWIGDTLTGQKISSFRIRVSQPYYQTIVSNGAAYFWAGITKLYTIPSDTEPYLLFNTPEPYIEESFGEGSGPAISIDGTLYFGAINGKVYALSPDGEEKWSRDITTAVQVGPSIGSDGTIYFSPASPDVCKIFAFTPDGEQKWIFNVKGGKSSSLAIGLNDTIYLSEFSGTVYAISPQGEQLWAFSVQDEGSIYSGVSIAADGVIYFSSTGGHIYALNPNGSLLWEFEIGDQLESSPVIGPDGALYVTASYNSSNAFHPQLYAIGPNL